MRQGRSALCSSEAVRCASRRRPCHIVGAVAGNRWHDAGAAKRGKDHLKGGLFQMAVDIRPLTREELVRSLPRELERLARSFLGRLRTERPPLGAPPSSSHRSMDLALSFGVSGGLECLSAIIPCSCLRASLSRKRRRAFSPALAAACWVR